MKYLLSFSVDLILRREKQNFAFSSNQNLVGLASKAEEVIRKSSFHFIARATASWDYKILTFNLKYFFSQSREVRNIKYSQEEIWMLLARGVTITFHSTRHTFVCIKRKLELFHFGFAKKAENKRECLSPTCCTSVLLNRIYCFVVMWLLCRPRKLEHSALFGLSFEKKKEDELLLCSCSTNASMYNSFCLGLGYATAYFIICIYLYTAQLMPVST